VTGVIFIFGYQFIQIVSDMNSIQVQLQDGIEELLQFVARKIPFFKLPQDPRDERNDEPLTGSPIQYIGAASPVEQASFSTPHSV
jgi:hypothetical protein